MKINVGTISPKSDLQANSLRKSGREFASPDTIAMSSNVIQLIPNVEQAFLTFPGYIQFSSYIYIYTIFQYSILKVPATTFPNATISISRYLQSPRAPVGLQRHSVAWCSELYMISSGVKCPSRFISWLFRSDRGITELGLMLDISMGNGAGYKPNL